MKTFASIYIGSNEIVMKVYGIARSRQPRNIDTLRRNSDLMQDIYTLGRVRQKTTENIIATLLQLKDTITEYRCDAYQCYATDALKGASNRLFVLDRIRIATGLDITVLSNSEHRFLSYEAFVSGPNAEAVGEDTTLVLDVSGDSMQLTLCEDGRTQTTQHLMIGIATIVDALNRLRRKSDAMDQVRQSIMKELSRFVSMYLGGKRAKYLVILGEQVPMYLRCFTRSAEGIELSMAEYQKRVQAHLKKKDADESEIGGRRGFLEAYEILSSAIADTIPTQFIMIPGLSVTDGMAYKFAYDSKAVKPVHDFDADVISACWFIAKRYGCYAPHLKTLSELTVNIFDTMKKRHGMSKRCRLLLQAAALLHDCGKYISLAESASCSQMIIMNSEILGLTHRERKMVSLIVAMNSGDAVDYDDVKDHFTEQDYLTIRKLLVILRIANTMDRSHKQKFRNMKMAIRDNELVITIDTENSFSLEKGIFEEKANEFEEVFALRPVIRERRVMQEAHNE